MLPTSPLTRGLYAFLICTQTIGCAGLITPPTERTDTSVIRSFNESIKEPGDFIVKSSTFEADHLRANIQRQELCHTVNFNEVEYQKVHTYEAKNIGLDIIGGLISAAGAGALFGLAPTMSDERKLNAKGEEIASNQEAAVAGGVLLGLTSLLALGSGAYVYSQTGDHNHEKSWAAVEKKSTSSRVICGTNDVSHDGTIEISIANRRLAGSRITTGNIDIDLRTTPGICNDESRIGQAAQIVYQPLGSTQSLPLAEHKLDNCIRSHAIQQRLESAQNQLKIFTSPIEFSRVAISLREASELLEMLPADDPDHQRLTQRHAALRSSMTQTSHQLLDDSLLEFSQSFKHADPTSAVPAARASLELSRFVDNAQTTTWKRIYGDYVQAVLTKPATSMSALKQLLEQDDPTQNCLNAALNPEDSTNTCSHWLDIELVKQTFAPIPKSLSASITQNTSNLNSAAKQLEKKINTTNYEKLSQEYDRSEQTTTSLCNQNPWTDALSAPCTELENSRNNAVRIARASETAMEQVRIKNTASAWRGQFAQCRKVQEADKALQKVRHCDANCQKIRSRIVEDYTALRNFSVEDATWDTATLTKVRTECRTAGCPRCP